MLGSFRICSSTEMKELDRIAEEKFGIHAEILMENAGRAASQIILEKFPGTGKESEILVFAGKGNNAGDAFVLAGRFICLDKRVRIFHLQDESFYKGAALKNFQILKRMKAKMTHLETVGDLQDFFKNAFGPFTIVDGILGTGLKSDLEGVFYDLVEAINAVHAEQVIALDVPSGVSGDTGHIHSTCIDATLTISFGFPKLGHFLPPGATKRGELINVDISLPPNLRKQGDKFLLMKAPMSALMKERDRYGHKNAFGHCLLIGGTPGRFGAIVMASSACHKMGTGLVTVATWPEEFNFMLSRLPFETMAIPIELNEKENDRAKKKRITSRYDRYSSLVIGPGLGLREDGNRLLIELLTHCRFPMLLDADALNLIAEYDLYRFLVERRAPTVLTPHIGEMARLLRTTEDMVQRDPLQSVREAVKLTHAIVLLKGAATVIGSPENVLYLNHYPNDGMATAGSGDVLSGMIGGLLGQQMDPFQATLLGVFLHSLAGEFAAKMYGHRSMTATDIVENISYAFKDLSQAEQYIPLETRIQIH